MLTEVVDSPIIFNEAISFHRHSGTVFSRNEFPLWREEVRKVFRPACSTEEFCRALDFG